MFIFKFKISFLNWQEQFNLKGHSVPWAGGQKGPQMRQIFSQTCEQICCKHAIRSQQGEAHLLTPAGDHFCPRQTISMTATDGRMLRGPAKTHQEAEHRDPGWLLPLRGGGTWQSRLAYWWVCDLVCRRKKNAAMAWRMLLGEERFVNSSIHLWKWQGCQSLSACLPKLYEQPQKQT